MKLWSIHHRIHGMVWYSKKIATHPQGTPQAIPLANCERNPFIACW